MRELEGKLSSANSIVSNHREGGKLLVYEGCDAGLSLCRAATASSAPAGGGVVDPNVELPASVAVVGAPVVSSGSSAVPAELVALLAGDIESFGVGGSVTQTPPRSSAKNGSEVRDVVCALTPRSVVLLKQCSVKIHSFERSLEDVYRESAFAIPSFGADRFVNERLALEVTHRAGLGELFRVESGLLCRDIRDLFLLSRRCL